MANKDAGKRGEGEGEGGWTRENGREGEERRTWVR